MGKKNFLGQKTADNLAGLQIDILSKLRDGNMSFTELRWFTNLSSEVRRELMSVSLPVPPLLSREEKLVIPPCDGTENLVNAEDVFPGNLYELHENCKDWGLDNPSISTDEKRVEAFKFTRSMNSAETFGYFRIDLRLMCFTQHQIKSFCQEHAMRFLERGNVQVLLFLFKEGKSFFVAHVRKSYGQLLREVKEFENGGAYTAGYPRCVIIPVV